LFTWNDDEELHKGLKIVIIKGLFSLEEVAKEPSAEQFFKELEQDIREECTQKVGEIERLAIYDVFSISFIDVRLTRMELHKSNLKLPLPRPPVSN